MTTSRRSKLPSIWTLLAVSGALILVPSGTAAIADVSAGVSQLRQASTASSAAATLDGWIHLSTEFSTEINATGAVIGSSNVPDFVRSSIGVDFTEVLATARSNVDRLVIEVDAGAVGADIAAVRRQIDEGEVTAVEAVDHLLVVADELETSLGAHLVALSKIAGEASGGGELVSAAVVADAMASVMVASSDHLTWWTRVTAPFASPDVSDIRRLSDSLAIYELSVADLESAFAPGSDAELAWADFRSDGSAAALHQRYEATSDALVVSGVVGEPAVVGFTPDMAPALMAQLQTINETVQQQEVVMEQLDEVLHAALGSVQEAAAELESSSRRARNLLVFALALFGSLMLLVGIMLVRIIARPLGRMAEVVHGMVVDGQLDERVEEKGPRELRAAAGAMNEAIEALKHVERQAVALAEERLDDPVLALTAPGALGTSLQAAVARLTDSMNDRDDFQRRLAHEASHDGLTLLPNRNATLVHLDAALARTKRAQSSVALMFLDLDGFKPVNDLHGHQIGDALLRTSAHRLRAAIRAGDHAGRLGGDEFVVVAEPVDDIDEALELAARVMAALTEPLEVGGITITPSVSIGVALSGSSDMTADELLREADLAVYRAKESGRGRIEVCDEDLRRQVLDRMNLEQAITLGLANEEFVLHFQPIIDTATKQMTSLEALVRWDRGDEGLQPPVAFIPLAERSDLIIDIDRWVLNAAAAQIADWQVHPLIGGLPVSVNISGRHLSSGSMATDVKEALDRRQVDPSLLIVEITETALLDDLGQASRQLEQLRKIGVRVALDDYGTGYMSLATLRKLPVDVLKIDRSFVSRLDEHTEHSLVELMVNTGHLLGVEVTAEGVETNEQEGLLAAMGSDHLQGYLFSRPVAPDALEAQLDLMRVSRDDRLAVASPQ